MNLASQAYIQWLFEQERARQDNIAAFRDYYDGDQQSYLTERAEEYLEHHGRELRFCLNLCPVVVDTPSDRMAVSGFRVSMPPSLQAGEDTAGADDEQSPEDEWGEVLNEWWTDNRCDGLQRMVYKSAFRDGESYAIVDWDEEHMRPRINYQPAFTSYGGNSNNGQGVKVHYAEGGNVYCASKRWKEDTFDESGRVNTIQRINLYFDDHIEMWYSTQDSNDAMWQRWTESGGDGVIRWVGKDGKGLGVPVFHFKNCDVGYTHGISELKSVIPVQNAINKLLIDMLQQADYEAFGVFWQTGGERPDGYIFPGALLWAADPETQFGRIEPNAQSHFIETIDANIKWIASITRTPQYMFYQTGQMPSGEAMKTAESGLVAKIRDRQVGFGNAWEDVMHMCITLQNAFGGGIDIPEGALITCLWNDPETQTMEGEIARARFLVENGYEAEALRLMGYDDTEIERMKREKAEEQVAQANIGAAFAAEARRRMEQVPVPPGAPAVARRIGDTNNA